MNRLGLRPHALRAAYIASASLLSIATAAPAFAAQPAADQPSAAQPAGAQPAPAESPDIVVTAQFREQRLQDTPLAITAMSAEMMQQRGQQSLVEVTSQAPNVTLRQQGASFGPSIGASIRGIGQFDFNPAFEPGVGLYVDDVYYSSLTGANFELLDLERIEILRGPQGTLAGRNSVGGSIRMITRRPDADGGGFVEASYGSRNMLAFRGGATFTLADGLYARISGVSRQQTGYVDRIDYGCSHPTSGIPSGGSGGGDCVIDHHGGIGYTALRGQLRYHPGPGFDLVIAGDYVRDDRTIAPEVLVATQAPGNTANLNLPVGTSYDNRFICGRFCNYSAFAQPAGTWAQFPYPLVATSGTDQSHYEGWGVSANMDINVAEGVQLQSISAYRAWRNRFNADDDLSPASIGFGQNHLNYWFWSQELRLNAHLADTLDLTVGGYYNDQRTTYFTFQDIRYAPIPLQFIGNDPVNTDSWAAFATAIWHPIDGLTVTGGLRYTKEHKDYTFVRVNPDGVTPNPFLGALNGVTGIYNGDRIDYRGSIDYRFSPAVLAYATVSTGFKGGGIGPRPFNPAQARPFNPETLTNYEVGLKLDLFDRVLRFNAAAFYNQYHDIQLVLLSCPQFGGPGPCALPQNAGNAHIKGLEFETYIHPTTGLTIDGSLSWIGFDYTCVNITVVRPLNLGETDSCSSAPAIINGLSSRPPATPEWKWSFGIQYEIPTSVGSITPRFDMSHQSGTSGGVAAGGFNLPGFTVANARLTWRDNSNNWQAALEVTNLFDHYYLLTTFDLRGAGAGFVKAQPGHPREWALTITRRF